MAQITVGELKEQLDLFPSEMELSFSGLTFYRLKQRGPQLVQVEFNEVVFRDGKDRLVVEDLALEDPKS